MRDVWMGKKEKTDCYLSAAAFCRNYVTGCRWPASEVRHDSRSTMMYRSHIVQLTTASSFHCCRPLRIHKHTYIRLVGPIVSRSRDLLALFLAVIRPGSGENKCPCGALSPFTPSLPFLSTPSSSPPFPLYPFPVPGFHPLNSARSAGSFSPGPGKAQPTNSFWCTPSGN